MRILVYGAGVLGCELAHVLMQNKKNVVTLLARGEWKEMIDQKGLVIRHWVQRKTTTERIKTVDTLAPDDYYDLVFVVVQASQLPDVLPVLKANKSQYFVFVGNNPQAKQVLEFMQRPWRSCRPCSARRIRSHSAFRARQAAVNTTMWSVCTPVLA